MLTGKLCQLDASICYHDDCEEACEPSTLHCVDFVLTIHVEGRDTLAKDVDVSADCVDMEAVAPYARSYWLIAPL